MGRLGPARRRRRRRPPARVLRPGRRAATTRASGGTNPDPLRIGFPIAEVEADGTAVSPSRRAPAGGSRSTPCASSCSTRCTTPRRYLNPDVVADFTSLTLDDLGDDRVRVTGARGAPAARHLQGSRVHARGLGGRGALRVLRGPTPRPRRARRCRFVRRRAEQRGAGGRGVARGVLRRERVRWPHRRPRTTASEPPEVIGRLAWRCADEATAAAGVAAGRRRARPVRARR